MYEVGEDDGHEYVEGVEDAEDAEDDDSAPRT